VASYSGQSPLWRFVTLHYPPPQKEKGKGNSVAFYFLQKNEDEVFTKKKKTSKFDHWKSFGFATKMACRYLRVSND
jgi:hypothetical protein